MRTPLSRLGLTLALATALSAAAQQPRPASPAADPLISDCKTISCLRNLLRGAEGPPGPRGPAGRSAVQDVYAGSVRLGRLIAMDGVAFCSAGTGSSRADEINAGLLGLVETSTGYIVQLCIGAKFTYPSVGIGIGAMARGMVDLASHYFVEPGCQGVLYTPVRTIGGGLGLNFTGPEYDSALGGMFGPVMGKPRAIILPEREINLPPGNGRFGQARFAIAGPPVQITPKSYYENGGPNCKEITRPAQPDVYVQITPNDPAITGLPNEPITPYTLVDVQ